MAKSSGACWSFLDSLTEKIPANATDSSKLSATCSYFLRDGDLVPMNLCDAACDQSFGHRHVSGWGRYSSSSNFRDVGKLSLLEAFDTINVCDTSTCRHVHRPRKCFLNYRVLSCVKSGQWRIQGGGQFMATSPPNACGAPLNWLTFDKNVPLFGAYQSRNRDQQYSKLNNALHFVEFHNLLAGRFRASIIE